MIYIHIVNWVIISHTLHSWFAKQFLCFWPKGVYLKELSDQIKSTYGFYIPAGWGRLVILAWLCGNSSLGLLECSYSSSTCSFFGVWPRCFTFIGKCLHLPLVFSASFFAFPPTVCFKTGFQIGCVPSVEDYSNPNRPSASWAAFLVWCGSFLLAAALGGGWNSGLQRVWQKCLGLPVLKTGPFSTLQKPGRFVRALWVNVRSLSWWCFKFLLAACRGRGTDKAGIQSFPTDSLKHFKRQIFSNFPWLPRSLETALQYCL